MRVILQADQRRKQNHKDAILPAHPREPYHSGRELGLVLNHENIRSPIIRCRRKLIIFFVMVAHFEKMMERLNSGEYKIIFRNILCIVIIGRMKSGEAAWQEEEVTREDFTATMLHLRALQGQSGRNFIDPLLQDNVEIPDGFCKYIYHVGCAIHLHAIINSLLISGGQKLSNRQTVFFLLVDPMEREHEGLATIDLGAPRLAQYTHKAWKYIKTRCKTCSEGFKFYQTRSNAIILYDTLPAYCIPKAVMMKSGEVIYEKSICVTSTSSR